MAFFRPGKESIRFNFIRVKHRKKERLPCKAGAFLLLVGDGKIDRYVCRLLSGTRMNTDLTDFRGYLLRNLCLSAAIRENSRPIVKSSKIVD